jgi:hypothetical protein
MIGAANLSGEDFKPELKSAQNILSLCQRKNFECRFGKMLPQPVCF